ncbi:hypothetical protein Ahy_B03g065162 [Arachis hypogaea]|uniref:Uncharacterized protein n=1 Tax=Arachis hypogaea TaxID=3818 RepID=A0A445A0W5_ARAHY|nr:hypothetical protein Ahy_B03g065162 [Arachis hypogaea]
MSEEKKTIVRDLGFGGLMHIPPLRVHHQLLRELANNIKLGENRLETGYGSFKIRPKTIGDALGINTSRDLFPQKVNYKDLSEDDKEIFRRFQGKTLKNLTDEMMDIGVSNEQDRLMKASSTSSSEIETNDSDNSTSESETQEDSVDSPRKEPSKKGKKMESKKRKKNQEDSDSESESTDETQSKKKKVVVEDSSPEQPQSYHGSEIGSEDLDELLRKNNKNSAAQGEKEADLRSTKGHYVSSKTIPDVNLGSDDPSSQRHTEQSSVNKPAESMLSLVEESASEPADSNMMVVREKTPSERLAIVPIQVCLLLSQTTTVPKFEETPETEYEPTPLLQIEGTTKTTPKTPPNNLKKAHPRFPPAPSKIPRRCCWLMMMARTASYVPKTDPMPSFSLGFTDSSQEETTMQEGASTQDEHRAKTPETPKLLEQLEDLTCYHWAIRVKTYANGLTDEFDNVCRLQAQDRYTLSKLHLASLTPKMHIEAEIVFAMCFIVNQQNIQRFQEEVYCLPPDIVNMALANHPQGVFLQPKNNKPFSMEDYPMFISFLDLQKLKSHRYIFAPVCHSHHWWLWLVDTTKRKFYIVDPLHNKSPSDARTVLNTFVDEVDHFRVEYASRILFHDMNLDKDEAIRESNTIRLSKPSSLLLSPYCQIDSQDVDTA